MPSKTYDDNRIETGTVRAGAQSPGNIPDPHVEESKTISRDDVRDGFAATPDEPRDPARVRRVLAASTLAGDSVRNPAGEDLGKIEEIMIDIPSGRIAYAVLSYGGFLGIGDKLFAIPWNALTVDEGEHQFVLDIERQTLENAPGFDKTKWPDMGDPAFGTAIHSHYNTTPYWEHRVTDAGDFIGDEQRPPDRSKEYDPSTTYTAGGRT